MTINRPNSTTQFKDYNSGEVFVHDGIYYMRMKIICTEAGDFNAVDLENGAPVYFDDDEWVNICNMELCPA